jgi:signal transduction histidine kinase/DNA-binding response OmpR family regulator
VLSTYFPRMKNALRLRGPLADDPTAQILHTVLLALMGWVILDFTVGLAVSIKKLATVGTDSFQTLFVVVPLILLRRGSLRMASLVYLSGFWLLATVAIVLSGGIRTVIAVVYLVLPISAAWLLGYRAALLNAGVCLGSLLIMAVLEMSGRPLPLYFPGTPLGLWITVMAAMIMAAVPIAHILQIYKNALARLRDYQGHLEELVAERTAELLAANQAKSAFLATMSHELRTPLNAILGFSAQVRDAPSLPEEHRRDLDIVNRSGEHLLHLIDDVLDLAKIEAGRVVVENAPFDVGGLVFGVMEMMRARAAAKNIELIVNVSPGAPAFARSDAAKIRQVLINLLGNAVKFTDEGSVILRVDAKPLDPERILLIFEVEDSGIGIGSEDQKLIFAPFVQAGKSAMHGGTGLGLSITRQFVKIMRGTISVQSAPGEGSVFRVELPVEQAGESEVVATDDGRQAVVGLAPGQPECRVLVVEDNRENWLLLQRLLLDGGFQVRVAEDGAQAVEMFQIWRPHFIWMDLRLPVMGGLEATREIRALEGGREVRIAALTASAFVHQRDEVLAAGMDDFLRKPYRRADIFDCMARHLGVRYLYEEASRALLADPAAVLRPAALASLPQQLRQELADAVVRLDPGPIAVVIGRVSEQDAQLGAILTRCAKRFAYTEMLSALKESNSRLREETHDRQPQHPRS